MKNRDDKPREVEVKDCTKCRAFSSSGSDNGSFFCTVFSRLLKSTTNANSCFGYVKK